MQKDCFTCSMDVFLVKILNFGLINPRFSISLCFLLCWTNNFVTFDVPKWKVLLLIVYTYTLFFMSKCLWTFIIIKNFCAEELSWCYLKIENEENEHFFSMQRLVTEELNCFFWLLVLLGYWKFLDHERYLNTFLPVRMRGVNAPSRSRFTLIFIVKSNP